MFDSQGFLNITSFAALQIYMTWDCHVSNLLPWALPRECVTGVGQTPFACWSPGQSSCFCNESFMHSADLGIQPEGQHWLLHVRSSCGIGHKSRLARLDFKLQIAAFIGVNTVTCKGLI